MKAEHQPLAARFTRWALDHPWGYAALFTTSFFVTWTVANIAYGSTPAVNTIGGALLAFPPMLVFMRWIIGRPSVRKQWERRAAERPQSAEA